MPSLYKLVKNSLMHRMMRQNKGTGIEENVQVSLGIITLIIAMIYLLFLFGTRELETELYHSFVSVLFGVYVLLT